MTLEPSDQLGLLSIRRQSVGLQRTLVSFFVQACREALNAKNILSGWKKVGMIPWDPSKMLANTMGSFVYGVK